MPGPLPAHLLLQIFAERCPFGDDWPEAAAAWARWRTAQNVARDLDSEAGRLRHAIIRSPSPRLPEGEAAVAQLAQALEALGPRQREAVDRAAVSRKALLALVFPQGPKLRRH